MKSILILLSLTTISFITSGCQPVSPDQLARERGKIANASQIPVTNLSISGTWNAACVKDAGVMYRQDSLVINGNYATTISNYFSDSNCTSPLYTETLNGLYQLNTDVYGVTNLAVTWSKVLIVPDTTEIVKTFNQQNFCQISSWPVYQTHQTSTVACGLSNTSNNAIKLNDANTLTMAAETYLKK